MADTKPSNVTQFTTEPRQTDEEKRAALRARIEASEKRNQERTFAEQAQDAADNALDFAKKHPFAVIGGAVAVGLAIGAMSKPGRRLGKRGGVLASLALDAGLAYGARMIQQAGSAASSAGERFEDFSDSAASVARSASRSAMHGLEVATDVVRDSSRKAADQGSRTARALRDRLTH